MCSTVGPITALSDEVQIWEEERSRMVWFRRTVGVDPVAYLEGVADVIGRNGVVSINTSDRSQIQIFSKSVDATKLLLGSGIWVRGVRYKAYRAEDKPLRIIVEDVPPCVPNRVIAKAFEPLGACLPSDVECLSLGASASGFERIKTCRRVVWLEPKEGSLIPSEIKYRFAGRGFSSEIRGSVLKCFKCGALGHVRRLCRNSRPGDAVEAGPKTVGAVVTFSANSHLALSPNEKRVNVGLHGIKGTEAQGGPDASVSDHPVLSSLDKLQGSVANNCSLTVWVRDLLGGIVRSITSEDCKRSLPKDEVSAYSFQVNAISSFPKKKRRKHRKVRRNGSKGLSVECPPSKRGRVGGGDSSAESCSSLVNMEVVSSEVSLESETSVMGEGSDDTSSTVVSVRNEVDIGPLTVLQGPDVQSGIDSCVSDVQVLASDQSPHVGGFGSTADAVEDISPAVVMAGESAAEGVSLLGGTGDLIKVVGCKLPPPGLPSATADCSEEEDCEGGEIIKENGSRGAVDVYSAPASRVDFQFEENREDFCKAVGVYNHFVEARECDGHFSPQAISLVPFEIAERLLAEEARYIVSQNKFMRYFHEFLWVNVHNRSAPASVVSDGADDVESDHGSDVGSGQSDVV